MILIANDVSWNHIIIQSFHHHEDASLALWSLLFHYLHFGIIVDTVVLSSLLSLLVYSLYCYFHVIVVSSVISFCHYRHFSVFPFVIIIVIVIYHRHRFVTMVTYFVITIITFVIIAL